MKDLENFVVTKQPARHTKPQAAEQNQLNNSVTLIYVPLYYGGPHRGTSMGPAAMQVAGLSERLEKLGVKIAGEVAIKVAPSACWLQNDGTPRCVPEIRQVSLDIANAVEMALHNGTIPVTIGGDHSLAIGSLSGVSSYYRKENLQFGLVWFDAHGDINTPETSPSGNVHGMPLAASLGYGDKRFTELLEFSPKVDPKRTALIGARDLDQLERDMVKQSGITMFGMQEVVASGIHEVTSKALAIAGNETAGIHVSFDIDVLDPDTAPGVSTPARGGMQYREAAHALTMLAQSGLVRSIDVTELNPANDLRNQTAHIAVDLALTALGLAI